MSRRGALSIALTAVVLAAGLGAGCGDDGDEGPDDAAERRSLLYVADARSGTLIGWSNDDYILRLEGLASSIVGFSDRPNRVTLNVPTEDFFASWDAKFAGDPPNAALDISGAARGDASAFELTNPRLSGGSVKFDARRLKEAGGGLAHYSGQLEGRPPSRFARASLFIDDSSNDCAAQCDTECPGECETQCSAACEGPSDVGCEACLEVCVPVCTDACVQGCVDGAGSSTALQRRPDARSAFHPGVLAFVTAEGPACSAGQRTESVPRA